MTHEEIKYSLHIEMLKQSFHREGDGMTSILLGHATSTAFEFFENNIQKLEQRITELEAPKTCDGCEYDVAGGYDCTHWTSKQEDCCVRFNNPIDYYEPKTIK